MSDETRDTIHQCDGEQDWCDDCEARETSKGMTRPYPVEDFMWMVETLFLGTLVEQAHDTLKDARDEGFEGLDSVIETLHDLIEARRARAESIVAAALPEREGRPKMPPQPITFRAKPTPDV